MGLQYLTDFYNNNHELSLLCNKYRVIDFFRSFVIIDKLLTLELQDDDYLYKSLSYKNDYCFLNNKQPEKPVNMSTLYKDPFSDSYDPLADFLKMDDMLIIPKRDEPLIVNMFTIPKPCTQDVQSNCVDSSSSYRGTKRKLSVDFCNSDPLLKKNLLRLRRR